LPETIAVTAREAELAARIRSGNRAAEEEFAEFYGRRIFLIAVVRTRDREAARDLSQEVLIAVLQAIRAGQLREADKLSAFVQGTARNLINNYLRTRARRAECTLEGVSEATTDSVLEQEFEERRRLIQRELESCSVLDRKILLYALVDGHSLAEVAERLELTHEAVRARKSRLVRKLMKKFAGLSQKRPL
jgi:RNA polymerase sigma factor (sigma-70 family)